MAHIESKPHSHDSDIEELMVREYVAGFIWFAGLFGFVIFGDVPLGSAPEATLAPHIKAPWVFGAIQQLLLVWPARFAGVIFPSVSLILLVGLPKVSKRWGHRTAWILFSGIVGIWLVLTIRYRWV